MTAELSLLIPEIVLFTLACIILVVDTFGSADDKSFTYWLSQSSLIVTVVLLVFSFPA